MKYIMLTKDVGNGLIEHIPILFPKSLVHADVAQALLEGPCKGCKVRSAGEVPAFRCKTIGESTTLQVKSDPKDGQRICMIDYHPFGDKEDDSQR